MKIDLSKFPEASKVLKDFFANGIPGALDRIQDEIIKYSGLDVRLETTANSVDRLLSDDPSGLNIDVVVALDDLDKKREFGNLLSKIGNQYNPPITFHQYHPDNYKSPSI